MKAVIMLILLVLAVFFVSERQPRFARGAEAQPSLSMPVESVNYTISWINGSLWATVDGEYPIYNSGFHELPLVYPTPPGTTNILLKLDGAVVAWSNYSDVFPDMFHHTGIGDWSEIYAVLTDVPDFFVLTIHYQHPVQVINGSYMFLYDLNIKGYLSPSANKSVANFNVRMDTNFTDLDVQRIALDDSLHPVNYTITDGYPSEISVQMFSDYDNILGDLLFSFKAANSQMPVSPEVPLWSYLVAVTLAIVVGVVLMLIFALGYVRLRRALARRVDKK